MVPLPILIDTDTGIDDALALILALRSPELRVEAITTVAGNAEVHQWTRNVHVVLDHLALRRPPVVVEGALRPLKLPLLTAPEVHGADGLGNTLEVLKLQRGRNRNRAVGTILDFCRRWGSQCAIVAIGPLTNLALAYRRDRKAFRLIGRIVSMGGAFRVAGNTGPVAEFNYCVDPHAAHIVLNSRARITVVPLDVTEQVRLDRATVLEHVRHHRSDCNRFVAAMTRHYMHYHKITEGFSGGFLHDPMTVAYAIAPTLFSEVETHVDVEHTGVYTRGMSVADFRHPVADRPRVHVVTEVDKKQFLRLFHQRIWN